MFTEGFFDSDGTRLHYIDWDGSGRALVLLAGLGGSAHLFRGLAPRLSERYRVVALTRRAHGQSERSESGYDIVTAVEDIRRFMDVRRIERATLVGHSWAGIEIPLFATTYPNRVEAVVYLDAVHVLLEPEPDASADPVLQALESQPSSDDMASIEAYVAFIKRSRPDLARIWCEAIEADRIEYVKSLVRYGPATEVVKKMRDGLGTHRYPAYGDVHAPALALVLGGREHPFLPPDASEELMQKGNTYYEENFVPRIRQRTQLFQEAVPDARIIELDTSNHMLFIAEEDATYQAIVDFLRKAP
jgi:pimeloyl-ACP methyl ester carboxylesterase